MARWGKPYYNARAERERRERETPDEIYRLACLKGEFRVSWRYRDDWLRERCNKMVKQGVLRRERGSGEDWYYPLTIEDFI